MIIEQKIPMYCSNAITGFSKMLGGPNYFPFIRTYDFTFLGEIKFTLENLRDILPYPEINGTIKTARIHEIEDILFKIMSTDVNENGVIIKIERQDLIISRVIFFLDCLQEDFSAPIDHFFIHEPAQRSYFTKTTVWSFCFIITNATKGMIVCGKTWHNAAACVPDNANEARYRKAHWML